MSVECPVGTSRDMYQPSPLASLHPYHDRVYYEDPRIPAALSWAVLGSFPQTLLIPGRPASACPEWYLLLFYT